MVFSLLWYMSSYPQFTEIKRSLKWNCSWIELFFKTRQMIC